ncbi:MAG: MMPL family transporter, partial [Ilumatobacteraceae bacterium]
MLTRLGRFTVRRRRLVLSFTVLFMVVAAVLGTRAFGVLEDGGFEDPASESARADEILGRDFDSGGADLVLVATAADGEVDAPAAQAAGAELAERVGAVEGVAEVTSYWSIGSPPTLRSTDGDAAILFVQIDDEADAVVADVRVAVADPAAQGGLTVGVGGGEAVGDDIGTTIEGDLARAELIAIPITLALLLLVFGGLIAASLPLFVGVLAVLGTFLSLYVIGSLTDVSIYAINLTTALGLGLAIDYSLFVVSRYREELRNGRTVEQSVVRAVETAGRTITISALTVAVSLSALLVFPQYFLRSFAYAGIAVVLLAMAASVVALPALLAVVGHRIDSLRVFKRRPQKRDEDGFWYGVATRVMRRPVPVALGVVAVLLLLGAPFLRVQFGTPDDRVLPASAESREVSETLRSDFEGNSSESFPVVIDGVEGFKGGVGTELTALATSVSALDGVARVESAGGTFVGGELVARAGSDAARFATTASGWLDVVPNVEMASSAGEDLVAEIRDLDTGSELLVGGQAAQLVDTKSSIADRLPLAVAIIVIATFLLLFLLSGSVLVPIKALVLNLLSLTATFGAMVWIFQDGNLSGLLGFTATGSIDTSMPILMFCIAFGLSMDYEVFLLSRIKEEHDRTGDNDHAVALGLERTGRIVTAAALLLSVTFFAFGTSGVSFIRMFGIGLGIAVLMDAFVIRGTLVPAFMKLAGEANWWAPRPLRRLHDRFGLREGDGVAAPTAPS